MNQRLIAPLPGFEGLVPEGGGSSDGLEVARFGDGELNVRVHQSVGGRDCVVVGSVSPPADTLLAMLLAADALKAHGAGRVVAAIPYLAYARSDIPEPGGVQSIAVIGRALAGAGVDEVVTVDVHSARDVAIFPIPLTSLSPAEPLAAAIAARYSIDQVIAPDAGAFPRARDLAAALGAEDPLTAAQVSDARCALVVDDIVDSGRTLLDCCATLAAHGVDDIVIAVTHALFTADAHELLQLPVRAIFTTDTIPDVRRARPYLTSVVPIAPLLSAALLEAETVASGDA